ncbi:GntR family transcriptional regulator [Leisingera sp. ANG-M1]|uniref:GntR family transcriptional regulator n=1 Tax=Leisingera sp. ANG-M1 TaxID=1577895 RepID=UPI00057E39C5|nr:GntR family transcriptional regulator [Leisingera sp. ANG-M1]KIC09582.1 GntR family transcriptional regulator [Leisingera sp. ANG-M1]
MSKAQDVQLLADQARDALWAALRSGALRAGQFLSMPQLVTLLDFPLAAVREAVKQASSQGLLITLPKRGIQVMEASPDIIRDCLDFRMVLDQEGARRRVAGGSYAGLEALKERHLQMLEAARSNAGSDLPPQAIQVDLSLHDFLAAGLENAQLSAAYNANRMRIAIIQNARPFLQVRIVSAMEEHLAVIEALESCDAQAAADAIRHHCEQTLRWWGVA